MNLLIWACCEIIDKYLSDLYPDKGSTGDLDFVMDRWSTVKRYIAEQENK
jgi:hypothetical protein